MTVNALLLFSGEPQAFGGLSNEIELAARCPSEFRNDNPWSAYAMEIFLRGADPVRWQWKTADEQERLKQKNCLLSLLGTFELPHDDKTAVAGWMLSEMLSNVPQR